MTLAIILSSGRCGSTALSDAFSLREDVLVLPELFSLVKDPGPQSEYLSGEAFWRILSTPPLDQRVLATHAIAPSELRYPVAELPSTESRFTHSSGIPPIAAVTLPSLTTDTDELYDRLASEITSWPIQAIGQHYRELMSYLARGRPIRLIVERSGGSLEYAGLLKRRFPEAKAIHLYRDGRNCAISMSNHAMYRMAIIRRRLLRFFGTDPYTSPLSIPAREAAPQSIVDLLPDSFDPGRFWSARLSYSEFGLLWSSMVLKGQKELRSWSPHLDVSYEALVASPIDELQKIADFLGLASNSEWISASASSFHSRGDSWPLLAQDDRDELTRSCRLGMDILFGRGAWRTA